MHYNEYYFDPLMLFHNVVTHFKYSLFEKLQGPSKMLHFLGIDFASTTEYHRRYLTVITLNHGHGWRIQLLWKWKSFHSISQRLFQTLTNLGLFVGKREWWVRLIDSVHVQDGRQILRLFLCDGRLVAAVFIWTFWIGFAKEKQSFCQEVSSFYQ